MVPEFNGMSVVFKHSRHSNRVRQTQDGGQSVRQSCRALAGKFNFSTNISASKPLPSQYFSKMVPRSYGQRWVTFNSKFLLQNHLEKIFYHCKEYLFDIYKA